VISSVGIYVQNENVISVSVAGWKKGINAGLPSKERGIEGGDVLCLLDKGRREKQAVTPHYGRPRSEA